MASCILTGLLPGRAQAEQPPAPMLTILIHNQAGVPAAEIDAARRTIDRIFTRAGVDVTWETASTRQQPFTAAVLLRKRDPHWQPKARPVMGMALASNEQRGVAMVYYDAVVAVALKYNRSANELLAIALAHEIGHVLLPHPAHSSDGLMRAEWEGDDIRHAVQGQLHFTPVEADQIRRKLGVARAPEARE